MKKMIDNNEKGITLVSLVITVIVLSILAGVLISADSRNDDVINIANQKKDETQQMMIEENIKIQLAENPPQNYSDLISYLKNYGEIKNEDDPDEATLITNQGNYEIKVKNIWNTNKKAIGVDIGDYIEYTFDGGTYTIDANIVGNESEQNITIESNEDIKWRVINVDNQNNTIEIVPVNLETTLLTLSGVNGYNNAVKSLNDLCNTIFSNSEKSITARSINISDIERMGTNIQALKGNNYGTTKEYGTANYPYVILPETNNNMQSQIYIGEATSTNLTTTQSYYSGEIIYNENNYMNLLPGGTFWLATRCINNGDNAEFLINTVAVNNVSKIDATNLYDSTRKDSEGTAAILPVVVLENKTFSGGNGDENSPYQIAN